MTFNVSKIIAVCAGFVLALLPSQSFSEFGKPTKLVMTLNVAKSPQLRIAQRIKIRPKLRRPTVRAKPRRYIRRQKKREDKSGGTSGRIDECSRDISGRVKCSSQLERTWNMIKSWF